MALATASKGASTVVEYYAKMKTLADEMASVGRRLEDDEMVSYILTGLNDDFDAVVLAVAARVEPISLGELYTQLISHEQRLELRGGGSNSSVNLASRGGRRGGNSPNHGHGGFSRGSGDGRNQKGRRGNNSNHGTF